jgi:membrane protein implicated in regulation of membrane protease activity
LGRILEILWFSIAAFCLGLAINKTLNAGFKVSYPLFIISLIALLMFFIRRRIRKSANSEKN